MGLGVSCYRYPVTPLWFSTLCQRSSPYAASPSGFCALAGCVGMSDSSLMVYSWGCAGRVCAVPLGFFSHVPCSSSGPAACAAFPDAGSLGGFSRSPGVCPSASLVTWVGFQPFPSFSMHLLLRLLAGVAGFVHPVSGCSRYGDVSLVWGEVSLLPFHYLMVGVLLAWGFSGIRDSSRLWVRGRIILPQAAAVGFGLWGVHTAIQPSHGSVLILHPGFLFSGLVVRGAFHRVPPPLSSFGMWSPFRVFSVFCHF